jgi:hypothetical protein
LHETKIILPKILRRYVESVVYDDETFIGGSHVTDVDDSYRMTVIEKIKGLMDEVEVIHKKEEVQLQKRLVSVCSF